MHEGRYLFLKSPCIPARMRLVGDTALENTLGECRGWVAIAFTDYQSRPCKTFLPELSAIEDALDGKVGFYQVNVVENPSFAELYGINAVPVLLVFQQGKIAGRYEGPYSREALAERFRKLLGKKL